MLRSDTIANLLLAFREPGCPICRRRAEHERRYLHNLLQEYVTDIPTRLGLRRSLGLCRDHAWELQSVATESMADGGRCVALIYEAVCPPVLRVLTGYLAGPPPADERRHLRRLSVWLKRQGRWGYWLARRVLPAEPDPRAQLLALLQPSQACPACAVIAPLEEGDLVEMVRQLADPEFQAAYAASDGLCLPHLRKALNLTADHDTVGHLVEVAVAKLELLLHDLNEYGRKYDWNYRHEEMPPWEQAAWIRAVAWFNGEAPYEAEGTLRDRLWALTEQHARPAE